MTLSALPLANVWACTSQYLDMTVIPLAANVAADAADDEGKCLKAEVEILRSHARRNATALAQLAPQTDAQPLPSPGTHATSPWHMQSSDEVLPSHEQQQQRQCMGQAGVPMTAATQQVQQQGQQQQHKEAASGSASEAELAAVEEGLSALEEQITAAALRYGFVAQKLNCAEMF